MTATEISKCYCKAEGKKCELKWQQQEEKCWLKKHNFFEILRLHQEAFYFVLSSNSLYQTDYCFTTHSKSISDT
jgi:hypothetical protein